jgi:hypothetical protein
VVRSDRCYLLVAMLSDSNRQLTKFSTHCFHIIYNELSCV